MDGTKAIGAQEEKTERKMNSMQRKLRSSSLCSFLQPKDIFKLLNNIHKT
jgi:hypothetical protein